MGWYDMATAMRAEDMGLRIRSPKEPRDRYEEWRRLQVAADKVFVGLFFFGSTLIVIGLLADDSAILSAGLVMMLCGCVGISVRS